MSSTSKDDQGPKESPAPKVSLDETVGTLPSQDLLDVIQTFPVHPAHPVQQDPQAPRDLQDLQAPPLPPPGTRNPNLP